MPINGNSLLQGTRLRDDVPKISYDTCVRLLSQDDGIKGVCSNETSDT